MEAQPSLVGTVYPTRKPTNGHHDMATGSMLCSLHPAAHSVHTSCVDIFPPHHQSPPTALAALKLWSPADIYFVWLTRFHPAEPFDTAYVATLTFGLELRFLPAYCHLTCAPDLDGHRCRIPGFVDLRTSRGWMYAAHRRTTVIAADHRGCTVLAQAVAIMQQYKSDQVISTKQE